MEKYICIHGHFYQPPRENPWLEAIELQDTAYPHHDWNERINDECYAPNAAARILDAEDRIAKITNNYARISFNFGPTLLSWMETNASDVYQALQDADRRSRERFSGHGSAFAQAYNHMIMPLANRRDKYTQVIWGIRDFERRFGRKPEGMWLPETAVDLESLEIMAEQGLRFTVLTQYQAKRWRRMDSPNWHEVGEGGIDPSMPYRLHLPESGRFIDIFFYHGPLSRAIAFEGLLNSGEQFANRLLGGFSGHHGPQLVHVATDGETYGHHHRHGEMALAFALNHIEANKLARITNYGEYLERYPPTHEVEIIPHTAWSCAHGVERWRSDCGCQTGIHPEWNQAWRTPLRQALDWLRDTLAPPYEERTRHFLRDPWAARDDYITVVLDRSPATVDRFLEKHAVRSLEPGEQTTVLKLLELQRQAMLMYTSCGWFFDDISGIETVQILQYAGRVVQLAEELFGVRVEGQFLEIIAQAKSNIAEYRDGAHIYEKLVKPAMVALPQVGAHYALSSLFETYGDRSRIYCYLVERLNHQTLASGRVRLVAGHARITSEITRESASLCYGAIHFGDHNLSGGVRVHRDWIACKEMLHIIEVTEAFNRADLPEVVRIMDRYFEGITYSLEQLFRDEQRKILDLILDSTLADIEANYRQIYERHAPLMRFLKDLNIPQPKALHTAAEFVLNSSLRRAFTGEVLDLEQITNILDRVNMWQVQLDGAGLGYILEQTIERMAERLASDPNDFALLEQLEAVLTLAKALPFEVDLWKVRNICYRLLHTVYPDYRDQAEHGDEGAQAWVERFTMLGDKLRMRMEV